MNRGYDYRGCNAFGLIQDIKDGMEKDEELLVYVHQCLAKGLADVPDAVKQAVDSLAEAKKALERAMLAIRL